MDRRTLLAGLLWDAGLPAAVFYTGRTLGFDTVVALTAGTLAALLRVGFAAVVRGRLNGLAAFVGLSFALVLVVSLLTDEPRVLLARESILSGVAGLLLTGSCLTGRPVLYAAARRMNAGDAAQLAHWDRRWRTEPSFRRHFTVLSAVLGGVLLAESAVRLLLIRLLPVDTTAGVSPALHLGTVGLVVGWALWYRGRRRRAVAARHPATVPGEAEHPHAR